MKSILNLRIMGRVCLAALLGACLASARAASTNVALVNPVRVDSEGVYLDQLMAASSQIQWPRIRLFDAPAWGQVLILTRNQIQTSVRGFAPELAEKLGPGNDKVQVTRRARQLKDTEIQQMLTETLQAENVRDQGELELRLNRTWQPILVPDEVLEVKVRELPLAGVTPNFIVRFELKAGKDTIGNWQYPVQASIWRDVYVSANYLKRGQLLGANDTIKQRRDILTLREPVTMLPSDEALMEMADNVPAGMPICQRSLRPRPLVHRGDLVVAKIEEGPLIISLKVEVLEEGAYGQAIRVRNPLTRKELRGKVQNEHTVLLAL